ncbi:MAG TPA: hypothetical protein VF337_01505 [Candidatus Limnocylindrales bacterium]
MNRRVLAVSTGLLLAALIPGSILAANPASLDQVNNIGDAQANDGGHQFAQTFTTGRTGSFSSLDLWIGGGGPVTVGIEAVDGSNLPTGPSLATGTETVPQSGAWTNFPFTVPLSVVSGQMYALVFTLTDSQFAYGSDSGTDHYPAGIAYWFNTQNSTWTGLGLTQGLPPDLAFRTYVDAVVTPTPTPAPTVGVTTPPAGPTTPPAGPTTPPTSTAQGGSADGGAIVWFVPIGLLASFCGLIVLFSRQRRRRLS